MENDEKRRIVEALTKGGSVSIGQLSIGDNNTLNYYAKGNATPAREVTFDDAIEAAKKCSMYVYAQAAVSVFYAVCRDVYHWSIDQAEFERRMAAKGVKAPAGTIANTFRHNPYMRDHVDKWSVLGARQDVLKLRTEFENAIEAIIQTTKET